MPQRAMSVKPQLQRHITQRHESHNPLMRGPNENSILSRDISNECQRRAVSQVCTLKLDIPEIIRESMASDSSTEVYEITDISLNNDFRPIDLSSALGPKLELTLNSHTPIGTPNSRLTTGTLVVVWLSDYPADGPIFATVERNVGENLHVHIRLFTNTNDTSAKSVGDWSWDVYLMMITSSSRWLFELPNFDASTFTDDALIGALGAGNTVNSLTHIVNSNEETSVIYPLQSDVDKTMSDEQTSAFISAVYEPLTAVSGGPGTGKSYVVHKAIEYLLDQQCRQGQSGGATGRNRLNNAIPASVLIVTKFKSSRDHLADKLKRFNCQVVEKERIVAGDLKNEGYQHFDDEHLRNLMMYHLSNKIQPLQGLDHFLTGQKISKNDLQMPNETSWRQLYDDLVTKNQNCTKVADASRDLRQKFHSSGGKVKKRPGLAPAEMWKAATLIMLSKRYGYSEATQKTAQSLREFYLIWARLLQDDKKIFKATCFDNKMLLRNLNRKRLQQRTGGQDATSVLAMTADCIGQYLTMIVKMKPTVVVVEDAELILVAHVMVACGSSAKMLLVSGDVRLISNKPCAISSGSHSILYELQQLGVTPYVLTLQLRMSGEIRMVLNSSYGRAVDGSSARVSRQKCRALGKDIYWWNYTRAGTTSEYIDEGRKRARALRDLLSNRNEIKPSDISIVELYKSNVGPGRPHEPYVFDMDDFRGRENQVVIVNMVRPEPGDGQFDSANFVTQVLSRARSCLILIGDSAACYKNYQWRASIDHLRLTDGIGEDILLSCPRHTNTRHRCRDADVVSRIVSTCREPCGLSMKCGRHVCDKPCTSCNNTCHNKCQQMKNVIMGCGHSLKISCSEDAFGKVCWEHMSEKLPCGHTFDGPCNRYETTKGADCKQPCLNLMSCRLHKCTKLCFQTCNGRSCEECMASMISLGEGLLGLTLKESDWFKVTEIEKVGDQTSEYLRVYDRFERFIKPHHGLNITVRKIERVENTKLAKSWLKTYKELTGNEIQDLFHGTSAKAVQIIIKDGFRMPSHSGMFGRGIYFATDTTKSAQYSEKSKSNMLLLCKVAIGKTMRVDKADSALTLTDVQSRGYDSVFAPRGTGVLNDEYIVYRPEQALPRYIIEYL